MMRSRFLIELVSLERRIPDSELPVGSQETSQDAQEPFFLKFGL